MNTAQAIIEKLGGTRKAAALIGVPPSTVQSWKEAGVIPARQQAGVLAAARGAQLPITPADFFAEQVA